MLIKLTAVFHDAKCEGLDGFPLELGANPPMIMVGMKNIFGLLPTLREEGPFDGPVFSSRLARALCAASGISLDTNREIVTINELGQYGNKDGSHLIMYPGATASFIEWQQNGLEAIGKMLSRIWNTECDDMSDETRGSIILVSHRPIIGGLVAHCRGIRDETGIKQIVNDPQLIEGGYRVFQYNNFLTHDNKALTLVK